MSKNRPRIIPILLIENKDLIKTIGFDNPTYLGDPINALKIFNEKEVDELCIIDKSEYNRDNGLDYAFLKDIASEAFMPLSYGGGVRSVDQAKRLFKLGFEKVIVNSEFINNPKLVSQIVEFSGSQSVVVSIDYKNILSKKVVYTNLGKKRTNLSPLEVALMAQKFGAGEIILTSIDHEGKMKGYDFVTASDICSKVNIPVIINGGCSSIEDMKIALNKGASAIAASSFFVYYGKKRAVLINYPKYSEFLLGGVYSE